MSLFTHLQNFTNHQLWVELDVVEFKHNTVRPQYALAWKNAGFTPEQKELWKDVTDGNPDWAKEWYDAGFSPERAKHWIKQDIFSPTSIVIEWERSGRQYKPKTQPQKTR